MIGTGSILLIVLFLFLIAGLLYILLPLLRLSCRNEPEAERLRRFSGVSEYFHYFIRVFRVMSSINRSSGEDKISPELAEKVMLAVSGVNKCKTCSYLHTGTALEKGIAENEIQQLLSGAYQDVLPEEIPAVLFAQHFAETKGNVMPEAERRVVELYGRSKVNHMAAYLLSVLFGNLCCNTAYYYTHRRLSFKERVKIFPVYTLSRPVSWMIYRNGRKHNRLMKETQ